MKRRTAALLCLIAGALAAAAARGEDLARFRPDGRTREVRFGDNVLPVRTDLVIATPAWTNVFGLDRATNSSHDAKDGAGTLTGLIPVAQGKWCRFSQTVSEPNGQVQLALAVTAESEMELQGIYFLIEVPIATFSDGRCDLGGELVPRQSIGLPATMQPQHHLLDGSASAFTVIASNGLPQLDVELNRDCGFFVQDGRKWGGANYQFMILLQGGKFWSGQRAELTVTLTPVGKPDITPAHLTVNPAGIRYKFDGFGGNYCFGFDSPAAQYTMDNLKVAWARTEMLLRDWAPNDNSNLPPDARWKEMEANDKPDSLLRRRFLFDAQLTKRHIPFVISIWNIPPWLANRPTLGNMESSRIPRDNWPKMFDAIGSYLQYARRRHGAEPALFSFNEPDYGVWAGFSPEEHRDLIKQLGAHLEKLGLKTKMLLADVARTGQIGYTGPTAADAEAMKYVGAVAFHSWEGAAADSYAAWGNLADRLKVPLLVTELGVDANWQSVDLRAPFYAMREALMYQDIIRHARPRGTMQWEFTSDYSTVDVETDAAGNAKMKPTRRFWMVRQLCNLTPRPADVVTAASDSERVRITAYSGSDAGKQVFTCHITNLGGQRAAFISGLPPDVGSLQAVSTGRLESWRRLPAVQVVSGKAALGLPADSLTTLTTMAVE